MYPQKKLAQVFVRCKLFDSEDSEIGGCWKNKCVKQDSEVISLSVTVRFSRKRRVQLDEARRVDKMLK